MLKGFFGCFEGGEGGNQEDLAMPYLTRCVQIGGGVCVYGARRLLHTLGHPCPPSTWLPSHG